VAVAFDKEVGHWQIKSPDVFVFSKIKKRMGQFILGKVEVSGSFPPALMA
jgi:hypothetical protein